jgi:N-acetylglucosaminyldiphosphoundecaprenol N-acetyl-beta-D-mannosaminyltransferase
MRMIPSRPSPRVSVAGVPIDIVTESEVIQRVMTFVAGVECRQIVTANPLMILAAEKDPPLRAAFDGADLVVPDSVGVQWAARLQGRRLTKISGIDLMDTLCAQAAKHGWRVFFLGAAPGVAETAANILAKRHGGLRVVGTHHGYFINGKSEEEVIELIAKTTPDLLFVALSTPFQDGWIHKNRARLGAKVSMGVGGSFDVISGRLRRAPAWMRSAHLEWLFRLIQEPFRFSRMLPLPLFVLKVSFPGTERSR